MTIKKQWDKPNKDRLKKRWDKDREKWTNNKKITKKRTARKIRRFKESCWI